MCTIFIHIVPYLSEIAQSRIIYESWEVDKDAISDKLIKLGFGKSVVG